jgi:hypothetical protein
MDWKKIAAQVWIGVQSTNPVARLSGIKQVCKRWHRTSCAEWYKFERAPLLRNFNPDVKSIETLHRVLEI